MLGSNYESELLQLVDRENLPRFLGGGCNCAGGCENSDVGKRFTLYLNLR